MRFHLAIFLAAALLPGVPGICTLECPSDFRGKLVCIFIDGCHLDMEFCSMTELNCGRFKEQKHLFLVVSEGKCGNDTEPMCTAIDF